MMAARKQFSDDFMKDVERWGWRLKAYSVLMEKLSPWLLLSQITLRPLVGEAADALSSPADHRFATREELIEFAQHLPDRIKSWALEPTPDEFNRCWGAFVDGKLVAMTWRAYNCTLLGDDLMVAFKDTYRYGLNAYTLPEYRGKHILVLSACDPFCRSKGCTHAIQFIETHNFPSRRGQRRQGQIHAGYAGYIRIGRWILPFRTPLTRKHEFKFYRRHSAARESSSAAS